MSGIKGKEKSRSLWRGFQFCGCEAVGVLKLRNSWLDFWLVRYSSTLGIMMLYSLISINKAYVRDSNAKVLRGSHGPLMLSLSRREGDSFPPHVSTYSMSKHAPCGARSTAKSQHIARSRVERLHPPFHTKDRGRG